MTVMRRDRPSVLSFVGNAGLTYLAAYVAEAVTVANFVAKTDSDHLHERISQQ